MEGLSSSNMKEIINAKYGLSLSTKELNYIYNLAVKKCQLGDHNNALNLFQFLSIYETGNALYMKATAGCMQSLERYPEACRIYHAVWISNESGNEDCLFYMAYCEIKQKNYAQATTFLEQFLEKNTNKELERKANLLLDIAKKSAEAEKKSEAAS